MRKIFFLCLVLLLIGCASQRQKPVCAEIQYRLDHMDQSPDQRAWLEDELRDCKAQQEEYAKSDTLTNKVKKSIYELYEESRKDSSNSAEFIVRGDAVFFAFRRIFFLLRRSSVFVCCGFPRRYG